MKNRILALKPSPAAGVVGYVGFIMLIIVAGLMTLTVILALLYFGLLIYDTIDTQRHMAQLNRDVDALVEKLGYTPDALLLRERDNTGGLFIILPRGLCYTKLYFTTPLTVDQFTERVNAVTSVYDKRTQVDQRSEFDWEDEVPVTVLPAGSAEAQAQWETATKTGYLWYGGEQSDISIQLYDTMSVPVKVARNGHPIEGNIVEIFALTEVSSLAGCPYETVTQ